VTLSGHDTPLTDRLPTDAPNNGASERVSASISDGHTLVLKPKLTGAGSAPLTQPDYSKAENDAQNKDIDAAITFTGNTFGLAVVGDATQNAVLLSSVANLAAMCGSVDPSIRFFKQY